MKKTAILFLSLGIIFTASALVFGQKRLLADTEWKLAEAKGKRYTRTTAAISFDNDVSSFGGSPGCNSMSGSVDIRGTNIDFGPIRTTKRMCKLMAGSVPENVVLEGLRSAKKFQVNGSTLSLLDRRGKTLMRFTRQSGHSTDRLDDRKWVLEQIKGQQTFVPLPYAFLNFDAKKDSAGGDTSCNVFGGNYSTSGSKITFSNIISTMRACVEDEAKMATERDMLEGLRLANKYELRDGRLFLYRGRELLLTFRGEKK